MSFLIVAYLVSVMLCFNKLCDATTPNDLLLSRAQKLGNYESSKQSFRSYTSAALEDQVHFLPGWGQLERFNMFSGYITVDADAGRALFYVLVESETQPLLDPLLLWLNGGPGCSSLGGGFMSELGPFLPNKDGHTLKANPYPWNKKASILFLESPAFVGWSYSNNSADTDVGDDRTAKDSVTFLLGFMERFPHLRKNDLYLTGESYAGHYLPNLASEILRVRADYDIEDYLNLKGFLLGNPWTDPAIDNLGAVDYWWHHAMISDETAEGIRRNCNFSFIGPLDAHPRHESSVTPDELCDDFCNKAFEELGPINIYEIYADICIPTSAAAQLRQMASVLGENHPAGLAARIATRHNSAAWATGDLYASQDRRSLAQGMAKDPSSYDPCVGGEVEVYMNLPEVQKALHANQTVVLPWP